MKEKIFINKGSEIEKKVHSVEVEDVFENPKYNENETFSKRIERDVSFFFEKIKSRDVEKNLKNTKLSQQGEEFERRTLRKYESALQNKMLRFMWARCKGQSLNSNKQIFEIIQTEITKGFQKIGNDLDAHRNSQMIMSGIEAVYNYVAHVNSTQKELNPKEVFFIGTNDFLDAAREIDLLIKRGEYLEFTQVKSSSFENQESIEDIHETHLKYVEDTSKFSLEYVHTLVEKVSKNIEERGGTVEELENFINEIYKKPNLLLEYVKDEFSRNLETGDRNISNGLMEEASLEMHELSGKDFDLNKFAIIFEKENILHSIFMYNSERTASHEKKYVDLYNTYIKEGSLLPTKIIKRIENQGISELIENKELWNQFFNVENLKNNDIKKLQEYFLLMKSLDEWSTSHKEEMSDEDMLDVYQYYDGIFNGKVGSMVHNAKSITSVVVHGDKIHSKKLLQRD